MFSEIAKDVIAETVFDYMAVLDVTAVTFEILFFRRAKVNIIERMRIKRMRELAGQECATLDMQRVVSRSQRTVFEQVCCRVP